MSMFIAFTIALPLAGAFMGKVLKYLADIHYPDVEDEAELEEHLARALAVSLSKQVIR